MTDEPTTKIVITSFHPLNVTLPPQEQLVGKVHIVLPDIHVQVYDLSMGIDLLKGAHLGSDAPMLGLDIDLPEPVATGEFMKFIIASRDMLEEAWKLRQKRFDEKGALLG
jgi:hypothetical protein